MEKRNPGISYGIDHLGYGYRLARKIVSALIAVSVASAGVFVYLYHIEGRRELLFSAIALLATLPVDIAVLYSYFTATMRRIPLLLEELKARLNPQSIGAVRTLGGTALSIRLRDDSILYISISPSKIKGILIKNPGIEAVDPGLGNVKPPWKLAGIATALGSDLKAGLSLQCKSRIVELGESKAYTVPEPEHPRTVRVRGNAWYIIVNCPTSLSQDRLVTLLVKCIEAVNASKS